MYPVSQSEIELTSVHGSSGAKPGSQLDIRLVRLKINIEFQLYIDRTLFAYQFMNSISETLFSRMNH